MRNMSDSRRQGNYQRSLVVKLRLQEFVAEGRLAVAVTVARIEDRIAENRPLRIFQNPDRVAFSSYSAYSVEKGVKIEMNVRFETSIVAGYR
jgi:hypothetical protein